MHIYAYICIVSYIYVCIYICIFYMCSKMLAVMGITVLILAIVNDLGFPLCAIVIVRKNTVLK